jgi:hypothetical protein
MSELTPRIVSDEEVLTNFSRQNPNPLKVWVLLVGVSPKIDVPSTFMHNNSRSSEGARQS